MASKFHVPISTTQGAPPMAATTSTTGSIQIRAPLTIDDDDSSDFESNSYKSDDFNNISNGASGNEFSSGSSDNENDEGFESAEEFETASERPFVDDSDNDKLDESSPFVKDGVFRPHVSNLDEESLEGSVEEEMESGVSENEVVSIKRPIAQLSMDDDDSIVLFGDEGFVRDAEDDSFTGIVKVQSFGGLEEVNKVPEVAVLELVHKELSLVEQSDLSLVGDKEDLSLSTSFGAENGVFCYKDDAVVEKDSAGRLVEVELVNDPHDEFFMKRKDGMLEEIREPSKDDESASMGEDQGELSAMIGVESNVSLQIENLEQEVVQLSDVDADELTGSETNVVSNITEEIAKNLNEMKAMLEELNADDLSETKKLSDHVDVMTVKTIVPEPKAEVLGLDMDQQKDCDYAENGCVVLRESAPEACMSSELSTPDNLTGVEVVDGGAEVDATQVANSLLNNDLHKTSKHDMAKNEWQSNASFLSIKDKSMYNLVDATGGNNSVLSGEDIGDLIIGSSGTSKHIGDKLESSSIAFHSASGAYHDHAPRMPELMVANTDEEVSLHKENKEQISPDSDALATLLKVAIGAESDEASVTVTSADRSRVFSFDGYADSGSSNTLEPSSPSGVIEDAAKDNLTNDVKEVIEKMHHLRVKFLRLVRRLGHSFDDSVVVQMLQGLTLGIGGHVSEEFSLESAKRMAVQLEAEGKDHLDFSMNVLVLGKTGVGKSATINSIFGEKKVRSNAFEPTTTKVKEIVGTIEGVRIRVLDTPGLRIPLKEESTNRRILASIQKFAKKFPPDVVLYVDRLDAHSRDHNDLHLLRLLSSYLTRSIWKNAIVTLTHAGSSPPDGPFGTPLSFEVFVAQQSHIVQQAISHAAGDPLLLHPSMMHPVALMENHPSFPENRIGDHVLDGQSCRSQLLLLCYSLKILSEASSTSSSQQRFDNKKLFGFGRQPVPLALMVSSLLRSHPHPKLLTGQGGDDVPSDVELVSDSDEENEYDQLPPFKPLSKSQIDMLSIEHRKAYFDEYDYRIKLLQKKQWRQEVKSLKEVKKKGKAGSNSYSQLEEDADEQNGEPATVPVMLPDFILPPSFDSDIPPYRYRALESTSQLLVRPVLDSQGWDHDCGGYDGLSLERDLTIANQFPGAIVVQIKKDKKEFNIHLDSSLCVKHGEDGSTMAGFEIQPIGRQLAYVLRSETKFRNFRINKTCAGMSITVLGENVATGLKIEDQVALRKNLALIGNAGSVICGRDAAYGANIEVRMKSKDFPVGQDQSSLGLSLMKWRGDLGLAANLQTQFTVSQNAKVAVNVGVNSKRNGQISIKTSSSELQIGLFGFLLATASVFRSMYDGRNRKLSILDN